MTARGRGLAALLASVALFSIGFSPAHAAQTTTAEDLIATGAVYAGQDAVAVRIIEATELRPDDVGRFQFGVRRFVSEADAAAALDQSLEYALTDPRFVGLQPVDAPAVGDAAAAVAGPVTLEGVAIVVAIVFVQDGRFLHSWTAVGLTGDPLATLVPVAEQHFAGAATPVPVASPAATPAGNDPAGLLDLLPDLDDLPPGYVLESEAAGTMTPPEAATPAA